MRFSGRKVSKILDGSFKILDAKSGHEWTRKWTRKSAYLIRAEILFATSMAACFWFMVCR